MNGFDTYVTCPFEKSHRILKARFQTHLCKCRKNYPKNMKVVCIYDATHMLNPEEYEDHLSKCPTSGNVKCSQIVLEPQRQVGTVSLEEACNLQTNMIDEDWSGNNPTYDPLAATETKNIIRVPIAMSKSQKKQFKKYERERISALENNKDINSQNSSTIEMKMKFNQSLRPPKNAAKVVSCDKSFADNLISKLEAVSIEEKDSSKKENVSITRNNSLKKTDSQNNNLQDNTINRSNVSLISKNISKEVESDEVSVEESCAVVVPQNVVENNQNISEVKDNFKSNVYVLQGNNSKMKENYKEIKIQKDNLEQSLKTEKVYKQVKKVSTGRGFTIACKYLNSSMSKPGKQNDPENPENLDFTYGYNDE